MPRSQIVSCNDLCVFITTKNLMSTARLSNLLQVDATLKLNWNDLHVNRHSHLYAIAIIGTHGAASSYIPLFQTVKEIAHHNTDRFAYKNRFIRIADELVF